VTSRRDRLREIRAHLATLLQLGELGRIGAEREPYRPEVWSTIVDLERYAASLLSDADALEHTPPPQRVEYWTWRAEKVARQIEALAAWIGD
jgi:hypothetical protein